MQYTQQTTEQTENCAFSFYAVCRWPTTKCTYSQWPPWCRMSTRTILHCHSMADLFCATKNNRGLVYIITLVRLALCNKLFWTGGPIEPCRIPACQRLPICQIVKMLSHVRLWMRNNTTFSADRSSLCYSVVSVCLSSLCTVGLCIVAKRRVLPKNYLKRQTRNGLWGIESSRTWPMTLRDPQKVKIVTPICLERISKTDGVLFKVKKS